MADPASIFQIIAGSAGLALQCGKVLRDFHDLQDQYKYADLTITSITTGLRTVDWAWCRIQSVLENWSNDPKQEVDIDTLNLLESSLDGGRIVISALEEDLQAFIKRPSLNEESAVAGSGFKNKAMIVWNARALRDHQDRVRDQVNSMNLLISVLSLPNPSTRKQTLSENAGIIRKSDASAYSIVPSASSRSIRDDESLQSEASLAFHELTIDGDLFAARVYKRNYQHLLKRNLSQRFKHQSTEQQQISDVQLLPDEDNCKSHDSGDSVYQEHGEHVCASKSIPLRRLPSMRKHDSHAKSSLMSPPISRSNDLHYFNSKWSVGPDNVAFIVGPPMPGGLYAKYYSNILKALTT